MGRLERLKSMCEKKGRKSLSEQVFSPAEGHENLSVTYIDRPKVTLDNGISYTGQWLGNKKHGVGIQEWPDGSIYEGSWKGGMCDGYAVFIDSKKNTYKGDWKNDKANGFGIYICHENQETMKKDINDNKLQDKSSLNNGNHKNNHENNENYNENHYEKTLDKKSTLDTLENKTADKINIFENKIENNKKRKEDNDENNDNNISICIYKGYWMNDKKHGLGFMEWSDGSKYEGSYIDGQREGEGVLTYPNNEIYIGQFICNQFHGLGEYTWNDNRKYRGMWFNNQMNGDGIFYFANGDRYIGQYINDKKQGKGIFFWVDGRSYNGYWVNGVQHGEGIFTSRSGIPTKGYYEYGKRISWSQYAQQEEDKIHLQSELRKQEELLQQKKSIIQQQLDVKKKILQSEQVNKIDQTQVEKQNESVLIPLKKQLAKQLENKSETDLKSNPENQIEPYEDAYDNNQIHYNIKDKDNQNNQKYDYSIQNHIQTPPRNGTSTPIGIIPSSPSVFGISAHTNAPSDTDNDNNNENNNNL